MPVGAGRTAVRKIGSPPHLVQKKALKSLLIHPQHLQQLCHFLGDPLRQSGCRYQSTHPNHGLCQHCGQIRRVPQLLQKGLQIGIIPAPAGIQMVAGTPAAPVRPSARLTLDRSGTFCTLGSWTCGKAE